MGVQLTLVNYKDLWTLLDKKRFCSTESGVLQLPSSIPDDAFYHTETIPLVSGDSWQPNSTRVDLFRTGVYVLVFTNCGSFDKAFVNGDFIVKNAYGFLPGNEYPKLPFYESLTGIYGCMALLWIVLSVRWRSELI